jgi:hypothetical protein
VPPSPRPERAGRARPADLPVGYLRDRLSSYIYGNITVLAVAIAVTPEDIRHGSAVLTVLATAVLTFAAHVLSHLVAHSIGATGDDDEHREAVVTTLRGATPIATSGLIPAVLYAGAWVGLLPSEWAQIAATVILVVRIGLIGVVLQRFSGRRPSFLGLWGGIVLAAVAFVIALVKVVSTH